MNPWQNVDMSSSTKLERNIAEESLQEVQDGKAIYCAITVLQNAQDRLCNMVYYRGFHIVQKHYFIQQFFMVYANEVIKCKGLLSKIS